MAVYQSAEATDGVVRTFQQEGSHHMKLIQRLFDLVCQQSLRQIWAVGTEEIILNFGNCCGL